MVTDPGYRENREPERGTGEIMYRKRDKEVVFRKSNTETSGKERGGEDGEIWYLTSSVGGQEASMGRERLTAKDIERERQMELEQVSGGIKEREIDHGRWKDNPLISALFCECEFVSAERR